MDSELILTELPTDTLILIAGYLDLRSVNRFAQTCKLFHKVELADTLWELLYFRQPWAKYAVNKSKLPARKSGATWKSTLMEFKNLVFEKFQFPIRGFNWMIDKGYLPIKRDCWPEFLKENRGHLLSDDQISELLFRSIKSKELFTTILLDDLNCDLPLDLWTRKIALFIRPVPTCSPDLGIEALVYTFVIKNIKPETPEISKKYYDDTKSLALQLIALSVDMNVNISAAEFNKRIEPFLTCPALQRGSENFFENMRSIQCGYCEAREHEGTMLWSNSETKTDKEVYCHVKNGIFSVYADQTKETLLRTINLTDEELKAYHVRSGKSKDSKTQTTTFTYNDHIWSSFSDTTKNNSALIWQDALNWNIVYYKVLPW